MGFDRCHQGLWVCGAHAIVDIESVWSAANGHDFCAKLMKYLGRNMVGRTMGGIHHDLHALEGQVIGEGAFAKLNVTPGSVVQTAGFTQAGRVGPDRRMVE